MSTILEALKKSERERKLSDIPTLADMPVIEEPSPYKWISLTVITLFAVSIIAALIVMFFSPDYSTKPSASQIVVSSEETVAASTLSVLSYSDNAAQRFAIIDDKLVREGDFLATGIKVEEIMTDRVVLIVKGKRMSLQP